MTFNRSWHQSGTASVNNAETAVTGQSSTWLSSGIQEGDYFFAAGYIVPIAAVASNTSITLTDAWPGSNRSAAAYKIIPATDAVRTVVASRSVLDLLLNGNISSIAGLTSAADKVPYYTGSGTAALSDFKDWARSLLSLTAAAGKIPVFTSASAAAMRSIVGAVSQSSGVPTGAIVEQGSNANGNYVRYADGTQICWRTATFNLALGTAFLGGYRNTGSSLVYFAATFTAAPLVVYTDQNLNSFGVGTSIINTTSSNTFFFSVSSQSAADRTVGCIAIGRWF